MKNDFSYSLNAAAQRELDLSAIRWSARLGDRSASQT